MTISFPKTTLVNKVVPKTSFYRFMDINTKLKQLFINDVEKIVWLYKLASSTLNVENGKKVHEITVFEVFLKGEDFSEELFRFIDEKIPRHIIFIIRAGERSRLFVNYKDWIDEQKGLFSITQSFVTPWIKTENCMLEIRGLTLDRVYDNFVSQISGLKLSEEKDLSKLVELDKEIKSKRREVGLLKNRIKKEKQYNRQLELNNHRKKLVKELATLENKLQKNYKA